MRLTEFKNTFQYHNSLNPVAWSGLELKPEVRLHLLRTAKEFIRYLELPELDVRDIILVGSNANYNWNQFSDFDVHVVASYDSINCDASAALFKAKKDLWNSAHDVTIQGYDVEMYVQDTEEHLRSEGQFSLLNNTWITEPTHTPPTVNDAAVATKTKAMIHEIRQILDEKHDASDIERVWAKIKNMCKSGLESRGEFSVENLVFKNLRNANYLEMLTKAKNAIIDDELSLK
jgi:hypothetical protein